MNFLSKESHVVSFPSVNGMAGQWQGNNLTLVWLSQNLTKSLIILENHNEKVCHKVDVLLSLNWDLHLVLDKQEWGRYSCVDLVRHCHSFAWRGMVWRQAWYDHVQVNQIVLLTLIIIQLLSSIILIEDGNAGYLWVWSEWSVIVLQTGLHAFNATLFDILLHLVP